MSGECARSQVWVDVADGQQDTLAVEFVIVGYLVQGAGCVDNGVGNGQGCQVIAPGLRCGLILLTVTGTLSLSSWLWLDTCSWVIGDRVSTVLIDMRVG